MALNTLLDRHATYRANDLAVVFEDERLTWGQLRERVDNLIRGLHALGLGRGDKIAMLLDNSMPVIELYLAAAKGGFVVVPLSPLLRGKGLSTLINDSDALAVVATDHVAPHLDAARSDLVNVTEARFFVVGDPVDGYRAFDELHLEGDGSVVPSADLSDEDPYNVIYSSGTTGLPKGIVHTHGVREAYCTGFAASYRIAPDSVIVHSGSLVFNGSFLTVMPWMFTGCRFVLMPGFDAATMVDLMEAENVTHSMLVPSQIVQLLEDERYSHDGLPSVEMLCSVGAPLLLEHKHELARRFPEQCYELYGLTEGFVTVLDRNDFLEKAGSVGVPPPLYEMIIVDDEDNEVAVGEVGEICGRGPITMPGYYKRPDLTAEAIRDGWLHTGDLGYIDDDGFLFLVDRKKDLIISGGVNVYPKDIEEIIIAHPAVQDVTVFGVPHPTWGEQPIAAVVLRDEADPVAIKDWVNGRVEARYQKIGDVTVLENLPLNVAGKTLRRVVRDDYIEGREE
ncbi:MAG: class I adenylate-forming enzyme family protein [Actinomycetota bacterium]|nr:class I adenylate-forming enzyme family protein [Actinomycetota bacterium]